MLEYEDRVVEALSKWVDDLMLQDGNCDPNELLEALNSGACDPGLQEALDLKVWGTVLAQHMSGYNVSAIEGTMAYALLRNNMWQQLPEGHDREFIAIALAQSASGKLLFTRAMARQILPNLTSARAGTRDLAAALFGEPWCSLFYDSRGSGQSLYELIKATSPDLLPLWRKQGHEAVVIDLPDIGSR